jgi:hypothetical protein
MQRLPHGGPWSSYKFADLLAHVHGQPITANDLGIGGGGETAGPIPGMTLVTGSDWRRCSRDVGLQRELLGEARHRGVGFSGLDQLETSLCDYNSLVRGRYYLGHDIDQQMSALERAGSPALWEARAVFPDAYRGELHDWFGVRKPLKAMWRDQHRLYCPRELR